MLPRADNIDQRVSSASLVGRVLAPEALAEPIASFERQLVLQERNITERAKGKPPSSYVAPGTLTEPNSCASVDRTLALERKPFRGAASRRGAHPPDEPRCDAKKSERALREAGVSALSLTATALVMFLVAVLVSAAWISTNSGADSRARAAACRDFAAGDFDAQIRCEGSDEIASLANSFNDMALGLGKYRRSSLGELLGCQQSPRVRDGQSGGRGHRLRPRGRGHCPQSSGDSTLG
jgi:HAMP domain-containing protein